MTIQECYRQMGANYEDVLNRLYNEGMICRFTLMFLNDDSYPKLEQALKLSLIHIFSNSQDWSI